MNKDDHLIFESYGALYRGDKTEQDSKDYGMNLTPYMHIIHKLAKGTFDTDSDQDVVSRGELQGIFDVDVVDGHRQVVLTNDAIKAISAMHPELKDKFWECGKCKADYAGCGAAKKSEMGDEQAENEHPLGDVKQVPARDLKPGDVLSLFKNIVIKIDDMAPRLIKGKVRVSYKDVRGVVHHVDWNKSTKISVDNVAHENEEGDLMLKMKQAGMIPNNSSEDTGKFGKQREEEERCASKKK